MGQTGHGADDIQVSSTWPIVTYYCKCLGIIIYETQNLTKTYVFLYFFGATSSLQMSVLLVWNWICVWYNGHKM